MDSTPTSSSSDDPSRPDDHQQADSGVDRSLVTWMLSLSPSERLAVAQDWVNMVDAFDRVDDAD